MLDIRKNVFKRINELAEKLSKSDLAEFKKYNLEDLKTSVIMTIEGFLDDYITHNYLNISRTFEGLTQDLIYEYGIIDVNYLYEIIDNSLILDGLNSEYIYLIDEYNKIDLNQVKFVEINAYLNGFSATYLDYKDVLNEIIPWEFETYLKYIIKWLND